MPRPLRYSPPVPPLDLHVEERGRGRPVVLLHGWSFSHRAMAPLAGALAPRARVLSADLRGHGSSLPGEAHGLDEQAADVVRLLDRHRLDGAVLAGWSWGAEVALAAAALAPHRLAGLVLLAPTPRFCTADGWPHGTPEANVRALSRRLARDPDGTRRLFRAQLLAPGEEDVELPLDPLDLGAARATLDALAAADLRDRLGALAPLPALVVHGDADPVVPAAASAWLAARLPRATRHLLAGAGHAPHATRAAEVAALAAGFLEALA